MSHLQIIKLHKCFELPPIFKNTTNTVILFMYYFPILLSSPHPALFLSLPFQKKALSHTYVSPNTIFKFASLSFTKMVLYHK